jgi:hypothetical protein
MIITSVAYRMNLRARSWRRLSLRDKVVLSVALATFAFLAYVSALVLIVAWGAPLGRLLGILAIWSLETEVCAVVAAWLGFHLLEVLVRAAAMVRHYDWLRLCLRLQHYFGDHGTQLSH